MGFQWGNPGLFYIYFRLFKQTSLQFLQQLNVKKCPSNIRCQDSNSQPLANESPPITSRPGLPTIGKQSKQQSARAFIRGTPLGRQCTSEKFNIFNRIKRMFDYLITEDV